jgi:SP family myo-inositol transporter-like MFS transporter 13
VHSVRLYVDVTSTLTATNYTPGFYAGICFVGWILIILFYPEVSGLTLEEIGEVFKHGFGVSYARKLRHDRADEIKERMRTMEKPIAVGH